MMKNILIILISTFLVYSSAYSQNCSCYVNVDSVALVNTYSIVPMTMGTDTGGPPNYRCSNCSTAPIKLPFHFCFYGKAYDTVYINNKGSISFINPDFVFSSKGFPAGDTAMLAAFWSDIDNRTVNPASVPFSQIYYTITPTRLIVQWSTMYFSFFDDDTYNNFQITITNGNDPILPPGNNVSYCYWLMKWASSDSSGGSEMGFDGVPATVGVNKGDGVHYAQFGLFNYPGYTYYGPFDTNGQVYWLENKSFIFNTCASSNTIPPVIINSDECNTIYLCPGDTTTFTTSFLCPQQGQTATLSESAPGITGLTTSASNATSIYNLTTQIIPVLKDTGTHIITVIATDNSSPALKDSVSYTLVVVGKCADTVGLGINSLTATKPEITLYPNPNNGKFTVQSSLTGNPLSVKIYNVLGEQVYSQSNIQQSTFNVNLSSQPAGVYLYRILNEKGDLISSRKFIIQ